MSYNLAGIIIIWRATEIVTIAHQTVLIMRAVITATSGHAEHCRHPDRRR